MPTQFNNPPLIEAVCEFIFKNSEWDPTVAGRLYPQIETQFPIKENVLEGNIEFSLDSKTKKPPQISHSETEFPKFSNPEKNIFIILKRNTVSIHCIKPYIGWEKFQETILDVLKKYQEVASMEQIERIGLRYINKISLPQKDFSFHDYFQIKPPQESINTENIVAMQTGVLLKEKDDFMKTQFIWLEGNSDKKEFIIDIDASTITNPTSQQDWLTIAHGKIEDIFNTTITEKTKLTFS